MIAPVKLNPFRRIVNVSWASGDYVMRFYYPPIDAALAENVSISHFGFIEDPQTGEVTDEIFTGGASILANGIQDFEEYIGQSGGETPVMPRNITGFRFQGGTGQVASASVVINIFVWPTLFAFENGHEPITGTFSAGIPPSGEHVLGFMRIRFVQRLLIFSSSLPTP